LDPVLADPEQLGGRFRRRDGLQVGWPRIESVRQFARSDPGRAGTGDAMPREMPGAFGDLRRVVQARWNGDALGMLIDRAVAGLVEEPGRRCPMRPVGAGVVDAGEAVAE